MCWRLATHIGLVSVSNSSCLGQTPSEHTCDCALQDCAILQFYLNCLIRQLHQKPASTARDVLVSACRVEGSNTVISVRMMHTIQQTTRTHT